MGSKNTPQTPPPPVDYTAEAEAREKEGDILEQDIKEEKEELLTQTDKINNKKKGYRSLILTSAEGDLTDADIKKRTLLGGGKKT